MKFPPEQEAIISRCFHPSGNFVEFSTEETEQTVPERFERVARTYPERIAVKTKSGALTYSELDRVANRIAWRIAAQTGSQPRAIALLFEHGADIIAALLGVWKAGGIYVPIDPALAPTRNRTILAQSEAGLILTHAGCRAYAAQIQGKLDLIDIDSAEAIPTSESSKSSSGKPDDLAYILFTSGSTGEPKGVVQTHRNLLNQIKKETNRLHFCADDGLLLLRSCSVIGGVRIVLSALLNGAAVYPLNVAQAGLSELGELLSREKITVYDSTPTIFRQFVTALGGRQFPSLRLIRLSSEPVLKGDVELYRKHFAQDCIFVNSFGITETAGSIRHNLIEHDTVITTDTVPVGYAVEDIDVLLLDDQGNQVAQGEIGEIAVRSRYLSQGYWRNPELTRQRFLADPAGSDQRIYLTGDLGQLLPDGCLVHIGRKDAQVKIRGHKVDIAETERALRSLASLKAAVVIAPPDEAEQSMIAYVVPAAATAPTISSLRRALSEKLPSYMIPTSFVILDALPLTPAGKVDYRALPMPDRSRPELEVAFEPPRSDTERALARIWCEILRLEKVGVDDNFYDLGGDSLRFAEVNRKAALMLAREIPLVDMLGFPTIRTLAEFLGGASDTQTAVAGSRSRAAARRDLAARRKQAREDRIKR